jgi:hypothetical protein
MWSAVISSQTIVVGPLRRSRASNSNSSASTNFCDFRVGAWEGDVVGNAVVGDMVGPGETGDLDGARVGRGDPSDAAAATRTADNEVSPIPGDDILCLRRRVRRRFALTSDV